MNRITRLPMRLALIAAILLNAPLGAQRPCAAAFTDSLARRDLAALDRVSAIAPVWDTYSLANHALLLVANATDRGSAEAPVCAAIWRHGREPRIVELARPPRLSTPLYGMISLDTIGPGASARDAAAVARAQLPDADLARALRAEDVARLVVLPFPLDFARLGAVGAAMRVGGVSPALLQADFAVHESFHLHVQFPEWLDQPGIYAWPQWDRQPHRVQLRQRCYAGSSIVSDALRVEHAALLAAFDALDSLDASGGRRAVLAHAARFIERRAERYRLLDTVRVEMDGRPASCAAAEDVMEMQEATAQWVGHATTVRAGLVTRRGKRGSYARPQPEAFYQLGPLQLWVLDALLSDDAMRELTAALGRSPGPSAPRGTVFASFQAIVRAALRDANVRGIAVAVSARVDSLVLAEPRGARPAGAAYERALAASVLRQDTSERVSLAPGDEEDLSNYQAESWWMGVGDTSAPSRRWRFSAAFERYTSGVLTFRLDTLVERRRRAPPFESVTADSVAVRGLGAIERFATRCRFGAYGTDERIAGVVRDSTPDRWMQPRIAFFIDTVASRIRRMRADLLACRLAPNPD